MISTRLTRMLDIRHPVIQAGMGEWRVRSWLRQSQMRGPSEWMI
jgi:NAD(P)H-dependent flavin oxidoreductase YrpB (nitropropane dioxygenase family)